MESTATEANVGEEVNQGITRRDLLRRGAVLGGAVVWATPVVQTLGMGRAFAQSASPPPGPAISYIAMVISCGTDGHTHFIKYEIGGTWEADPGMTPGCTPGIQAADYDIKGFGDHDVWPTPEKINDRCYKVFVPVGCSIIMGTTKGGTDDCDTFGPTAAPTINVGPGC